MSALLLANLPRLDTLWGGLYTPRKIHIAKGCERE